MSQRRGFTLVELLVVIAILVTLTTLVVTAITPTSATKMREAGRTVQATILGARDRALHANAKRGFRLMIDPNNAGPITTSPMLATGIVYVQPIDPQTYGTGSFSLERLDADATPGMADSADVVVVHPVPGIDWYGLSSFFPTPARIRIPATTGQWYTFAPANVGSYTFTQATPYLMLTSSFADQGIVYPAVVAHLSSSSNSSCDIEISNDLLPNHAPTYLPSGVVIDLYWSSAILRSANLAQHDVMFSPRGTVAGVNAAVGPIHLFVRDVRDALGTGLPGGWDPGSPNIVGDQAIITIFPQTGHVAVFPVDTTSTVTPGVADDPFSFAKKGQAASG